MSKLRLDCTETRDMVDSIVASTRSYKIYSYVGKIVDVVYVHIPPTLILIRH